MSLTGNNVKKKIVYFKLHGSLTWVTKNDGTICVTPNRESPTSKNEGARCIVPLSLVKDYESYNDKKPFKLMLEVLRASLKRTKLCVSIGFSFRDQAIKNIFREALKENKNLKVAIVIPAPQEKPEINNLFDEFKSQMQKCSYKFGDPHAEVEIRALVDQA